MVALKVLTLVCCGLVWAVLPRPHRAGVPLGLVALGAVVTAWNLAVLAVGVLG